MDEGHLVEAQHRVLQIVDPLGARGGDTLEFGYGHLEFPLEEEVHALGIHRIAEEERVTIVGPGESHTAPLLIVTGHHCYRQADGQEDVKVQRHIQAQVVHMGGYSWQDHRLGGGREL